MALTNDDRQRADEFVTALLTSVFSEGRRTLLEGLFDELNGLEYDDLKETTVMALAWAEMSIIRCALLDLGVARGEVVPTAAINEWALEFIRQVALDSAESYSQLDGDTP